MSVIPSLVNAIFILNKKGEYTLYESPIEGGTTKVSVITKVTQGYRYYKVKQIIAFEDRPTIVQDFEINQDFAYKMIERSIIERSMNEPSEQPEKVEVVVTGQSVKLNRDDQQRNAASTVNAGNTSNNNASYKPALSAQLEQFEKTNSGIPNYNDASFAELNSAVSGGFSSSEFSSAGIKIANMSSFTNGQNPVRNGNKANYSGLEQALGGELF